MSRAMLPSIKNSNVMNGEVKVTANAEGKVVVPSSNPEFGYIRLEQKSTVIDANGWARKANKSALIKGRVADLAEMGLVKGMKLPGKLIVTESHEPTNEDNLEQDMKVAGDSGVPCTKDGQPIYRTTQYTTDEDAVDTFIAHDNGDAIREAQAELAAKADAAGLDS